MVDEAPGGTVRASLRRKSVVALASVVARHVLNSSEISRVIGARESPTRALRDETP